MSERVVDARGLPCPQPVVRAREALTAAGAEAVQVLVDDPSQCENVVSLAHNLGWKANVELVSERELSIRLTRDQAAGITAAGPATAAAEGESCAARTNVAVLVAADTLGRGDDELGRILIRAFVKTLWEAVPRPTALIFVNGGVRLTTACSELIADISRLADAGVEVLSCGTCLDFFQLKDKLEVGRASNMFEIVSTLAGADRVVRP